MTNKENEARQAYLNSQAKAKKDLAEAETKKVVWADEELGKLYQTALNATKSVVAQLEAQIKSAEPIFAKSQEEIALVNLLIKDATFEEHTKEVADRIVENNQKALERITAELDGKKKTLAIYKDLIEALEFGVDTDAETGVKSVDKGTALVVKFIASLGN